MKKFYWFGGSWVYGTELDSSKKFIENNPSSLAFPKLVSDHFDAECINLSEYSSSLDQMVLKFANVKNQFDSHSMVFFCIPPLHRISFLDDHDNFKNVGVHNQYNKNPHPYTNEWFKYFDNDNQRIYHSDCLINMLHFWCKQINVQHYFFNDTYSKTKTKLEDVHDSAWLIPRHKCLGQAILPLLNSSNELLMHDDSDVQYNDWLEQLSFIETYIRPNWVHPNATGHKVLADYIIEKLENM